MAEVPTTGAALAVIRAEFTKRCVRNARYSMRAFAKSLGLSHTLLSLLLSGKRPLTRATALRIAGKLALDPQQTSVLVHALPPRGRAGGFSEGFEKIDLETFQLMADWVHYAILSLLEIKSKGLTSKWIARRLGINETHAKLCFARLVELGMIEKSPEGWRQSRRPIKVENQVSTHATRRFQRQLLEKAIASLESDPVEVRDFSSMTLALNPEAIPYARQRIRQFRRELTAELEARGRPTEVYNLTVQIYPVSKRSMK